ncbi:MAG: TRAP transporter small permease [Betaproteobacteria bacterium]|nr:TRAP transporter small permease [Betaproteobacteria bacterium]
MLAKFDRGFLWLNRVLLMMLLALMSVLVLANVMLRYTTGDSIVWAEELSRYLMIWLTFLGAGLVLRHGGHLAIDNVQDAIPAHAGRILRALILLSVAAFAVAMTWLGTSYIIRAWAQTTPVMELPFGLVYSALPAGFLFLIIHMAMFARRYVRNRSFDQDRDFDSSMSATL